MSCSCRPSEVDRRDDISGALSSQHEILETPITVYNFQVEDYHTYYVTGIGVLVHNACENHHVISNKNKTFTNRFQAVLSEYGFNLNDDWNILSLMDHRGRHTNAYHRYILEKIEELAKQATDQDHFLILFDEFKDYIKNNPCIPYM